MIQYVRFLLWGGFSLFVVAWSLLAVALFSKASSAIQEGSIAVIALFPIVAGAAFCSGVDLASRAVVKILEDRR